MRPRLDRTAMLVLETGIILTGSSVILLGVTLIGGQGVQGLGHVLMSILWYALLACILAGFACLAWAISLSLASPRRRIAPGDILIACGKTLCIPAALHLLAVTRTLSIEQFRFAFFSSISLSPELYIFDTYHRLTSAQAVGVATLYFGAVAMTWFGWAALPLIRRAARPKAGTRDE